MRRSMAHGLVISPGCSSLPARSPTLGCLSRFEVASGGFPAVCTKSPSSPVCPVGPTNKRRPTVRGATSLNDSNLLGASLEAGHNSEPCTESSIPGSSNDPHESALFQFRPIGRHLEDPSITTIPSCTSLGVPL